MLEKVSAYTVFPPRPAHFTCQPDVRALFATHVTDLRNNLKDAKWASSFRKVRFTLKCLEIQARHEFLTLKRQEFSDKDVKDTFEELYQHLDLGGIAISHPAVAGFLGVLHLCDVYIDSKEGAKKLCTIDTSLGVKMGGAAMTVFSEQYAFKLPRLEKYDENLKNLKDDAKFRETLPKGVAPEIYTFESTLNGSICMVMEKMQMNLLDLIVKKEFKIQAYRNPMFLAQLIYQLAQKINSLHTCRIHSDIKPGNILINVLPSGEGTIPKANVRICDFSTSVRKGKGGSSHVTRKYLAPELWRYAQIPGFAEKVFVVITDVPRVPTLDIYSFGKILFMILAGTEKFTGVSELLSSLKKMGFDENSIGPLVSLMTRCLEEDPAHRYQSMEQVIQDLKDMPFIQRMLEKQNAERLQKAS